MSDDSDFKEIVLYEIRELRKEVKSLNHFKVKVTSYVAIFIVAFEMFKHKFIK